MEKCTRKIACTGGGTIATLMRHAGMQPADFLESHDAPRAASRTKVSRPKTAPKQQTRRVEVWAIQAQPDMVRLVGAEF